MYSSFGTVRLFIGHLFWLRRTTCWSSQRKGKSLGKKYWKKYLIFNQICKDNWGKLTQLHLCVGRFMHGHLFVFTMFQTCPNYHQDANYRPPTKLREGNIFSHVCQSSCSQGCPYCTGFQPVTLCTGYWHTWTCSNLFNFDLLSKQM